MFNFIGFTRDMTAGRGFIALGAVLLGARHPVGALLAALLFGVFEGLSIVMPGLFNWIPPQWIHMIPFVVTIARAGAVLDPRPAGAAAQERRLADHDLVVRQAHHEVY